VKFGIIDLLGNWGKKITILPSLMLDYQMSIAYNQTAMGDSPRVKDELNEPPAGSTEKALVFGLV
jgi:hypothetical protein